MLNNASASRNACGWVGQQWWVEEYPRNRDFTFHGFATNQKKSHGAGVLGTIILAFFLSWILALAFGQASLSNFLPQTLFFFEHYCLTPILSFSVAITHSAWSCSTPCPPVSFNPISIHAPHSLSCHFSMNQVSRAKTASPPVVFWLPEPILIISTKAECFILCVVL